jgi:hypothetical protein
LRSGTRATWTSASTQVAPIADVSPGVAANHRLAVIFSRPPELSMATGQDLLRRKLEATIFAARHERNQGKGSQ